MQPAPPPGLRPRRPTPGTTPRVPCFRTGATSFVYPAGWAENVRQLAGQVEDVELLLFDADQLPDAGELGALAAEKAKSGLSYTVHTPLSARLGSGDRRKRAEGVAQVRRVIELTRDLGPWGWVVHVEREPHEEDLGAWRQRSRASLAAILAAGVDPAQICVETLDYDFAHIEPVVGELGLCVTLDLGHLQRDGRSPRALLDRLGERIRVIHWHGVTPAGKDHGSLSHYPRADAREILRLLLERQYSGVLTLEVFSLNALRESQAVLQDLLQELHS